MKYVKSLDNAEQVTLKAAYQHHPNHRIRQRAHAILLSNAGYKINQLADIFDADRDTISQWIDAWESLGLRGLYDKPRSGRPSVFTPEEQHHVIDLLHKDQPLSQSIHEKIRERTGKSFSRKTLLRIKKKLTSQ